MHGKKKSFSEISAVSTTQEYVYPEIEGMSLQIINGELFACTTYTAKISGTNIEIQIIQSLTQASQAWGGRAIINARTSGHDTEGANIHHNCRFDGEVSWSQSPLQPSPSSYTFSKEIYGSGSRWVIVEGWINAGCTESEHRQVSVWVTFSLLG